jgi:hypothetical protein
MTYPDPGVVQDSGVPEVEQAGPREIVYLLWSGKHQAWWRPDARGYIEDIDGAGRYYEADALRFVLASAQCGIREQVTSMVAAPDNWAPRGGQR